MRVKANDVLDANAAIKRRFQGNIIGYFRRVGPNRWDDYELVRDKLGTLEILPGVQVQLSARGPEFRIRARGKVLLVRWEPNLDESLGASGRTGLRKRFVDEYCEPYHAAAGMGAGAMIAHKLTE